MGPTSRSRESDTGISSKNICPCFVYTIGHETILTSKNDDVIDVNFKFTDQLRNYILTKTEHLDEYIQ